MRYPHTLQSLHRIYLARYIASATYLHICPFSLIMGMHFAMLMLIITTFTDLCFHSEDAAVKLFLFCPIHHTIHLRFAQRNLGCYQVDHQFACFLRFNLSVQSTLVIAGYQNHPLFELSSLVFHGSL